MSTKSQTILKLKKFWNEWGPVSLIIVLLLATVILLSVLIYKVSQPTTSPADNTALIEQVIEQNNQNREIGLEIISDMEMQKDQEQIRIRKEDSIAAVINQNLKQYKPHYDKIPVRYNNITKDSLRRIYAE